ncbi:MAG: cation transporter [Methanobrevibacter sp.]|uniref:cation diffusion facilitator family transporter n=1 Tax=Methanobrevibacter sp. TaxID=66852 RepID=UPI0026DF91A9|nr:cation transporter [Methanobrevibacter sp.]MDO5848920.1 cation transporter [Methanobrevibacter sp.]
MESKTLISLDKFILLVLNEEPSSLDDIDSKLVLFISSIWYQQWDSKNKSLLNTIFDNISRIRYHIKNLFKRHSKKSAVFKDGFIDTKKECDLLIDDGLVDFKNGKYYLTENGIVEASNIKNSLVHKAKLINNQFFEITQAERNNTIINFLLAVLKLGGGYFSGCVSLISDGYDAISDTISAFFVWVGLKYDYQKLTNLLVIVMLFVAGFSALYESGGKLYRIIFATATPATHIGLVVVIEFIAIMVALFLFTYERHIGRFQNNLTLISQSVDAKNHILIGSVVIIGALFSLVGIHWIDAIIGLYIGIQIIRDSIDLLKEFKHEVQDGNVDYSRYKTLFGNYMNLNHNENLVTWILYRAMHDYVEKEELVDSYHDLIDNNYCPLISELGISIKHDVDYDYVFNHLIDAEAIIVKDNSFKTSKKGVNYLDKILSSFSNYDANILDFFILKLSDE